MTEPEHLTKTQWLGASESELLSEALPRFWGKEALSGFSYPVNL